MEWSDKGVILGVRRHGETSAIVEVMSEAHGRHLGLVRGGRSSRMRPVLQPGNSVSLDWRARLEDHLGTFRIEGETLRAAALMEGNLGIYGLQTLAGHLRLLPERDPHAGLYRAALVMLDHLDEPEKAARMLIRFEIALLEELGFGIDLSECAATGRRADLVWISPKSGRAVSRDAGMPYSDRLLPLPDFLLEEKNRPARSGVQTRQDDNRRLREGFDLALYFLERNVYGPRGIRPPDERAGLIKRILRGLCDEGEISDRHKAIPLDDGDDGSD
jgi:DNA repair protein RecO (recombination protein O)